MSVSRILCLFRVFLFCFLCLNDLCTLFVFIISRVFKRVLAVCEIKREMLDNNKLLTFNKYIFLLITFYKDD